jgi:hypothetical protein
MNPDPQRGSLAISTYLWVGPFWYWYCGTRSTWDTISINKKMLITFPTFRPKSTEAWIIILTTSIYINIVHISGIQGWVCILLWVLFFILGPLAMFHMLQCLIWFRLFWPCAVMLHVSWLQSLTDPMPGISFLPYPFSSTAGFWGMSNVNFSDPSRVYAVEVRGFPDDTNREWWEKNKLMDPIQSTGDVATSSAFSTQCLQMTCSTRLSAQWGWQNRRGERNNILDSKVRLQTADGLGSTGEWNLQYPEPT